MINIDCSEHERAVKREAKMLSLMMLSGWRNLDHEVQRHSGELIEIKTEGSNSVQCTDCTSLDDNNNDWISSFWSFETYLWKTKKWRHYCKEMMCRICYQMSEWFYSYVIDVVKLTSPDSCCLRLQSQDLSTNVRHKRTLQCSTALKMIRRCFGVHKSDQEAIRYIQTWTRTSSSMIADHRI